VRRAAQEEVDIAEAAMRILWLNDRAAAVRALLAMLTRLSEAEQGRFCPLLGTMLETHDDDTIRQVIDWLERERVKPDPSLIEELARHSLVPAKEWAHWLESPTTQKRAAIMATLGHSWEPESGLQAIAGIVQLLHGNDEGCLMGIRALGGLQRERYAHYLVPYLYKPAAAIQKETLFTVNCLVNPEYTDAQLIILEFVLQILALGGRLPDYEMISSSLHSQNPKMRANAIEALEQACNRAIFLRLLPLVDSRPMEDIMRFYQRHAADAELTPATIIAKASHSHVPLERSAAAQTMWDLAVPDVLNTLRQQLRDTSSSLFRDTVTSLFIRESNGMSSNPIEMIALLSRTAFFTSFSVLDLVTLAAGISEVSFPAQQAVYRQGEAAHALYVIKTGNITLNGYGQVLARGVGDTFSEDTIYAAGTYREDAISRSASVYVVERDYLMQCARTHPRIALGLIEKHVCRDEKADPRRPVCLFVCPHLGDAGDHPRPGVVDASGVVSGHHARL